MIECIFAGLGGFLGSISRYLLGKIPVKNPSGFPVMTFLINITGAFIIGIIAGTVFKNKNINPKLITFLKTGFCGGFTTFSTFALETENLFKNKMPICGILYIVLSVSLGIAAVYAGEQTAEII